MEMIDIHREFIKKLKEKYEVELSNLKKKDKHRYNNVDNNTKYLLEKERIYKLINIDYKEFMIQFNSTYFENILDINKYNILNFGDIMYLMVSDYEIDILLESEYENYLESKYELPSIKNKISRIYGNDR